MSDTVIIDCFLDVVPDLKYTNSEFEVRGARVVNVTQTPPRKPEGVVVPLTLELPSRVLVPHIEIIVDESALESDKPMGRLKVPLGRLDPKRIVIEDTEED